MLHFYILGSAYCYALIMCLQSETWLAATISLHE